MPGKGYLNSISLAEGALIVPIFWGSELDLPVLVWECFWVHYFEAR